jgi:hypothetical protein
MLHVRLELAESAGTEERDERRAADFCEWSDGRLVVWERRGSCSVFAVSWGCCVSGVIAVSVSVSVSRTGCP